MVINIEAISRHTDGKEQFTRTVKIFGIVVYRYMFVSDVDDSKRTVGFTSMPDQTQWVGD